MATAQLIGGLAHGHTCTVPDQHGPLSITMIKGHAQVFDPEDSDAPELLNQAHERWHTYHPVTALGPSPGGLIAYRCWHDLPQPLEYFLDRIQATTDQRPEAVAARWLSIERLLRQTANTGHPT